MINENEIILRTVNTLGLTKQQFVVLNLGKIKEDDYYKASMHMRVDGKIDAITVVAKPKHNSIQLLYLDTETKRTHLVKAFAINEELPVHLEIEEGTYGAWKNACSQKIDGEIIGVGITSIKYPKTFKGTTINVLRGNRIEKVICTECHEGLELRQEILSENGVEVVLNRGCDYSSMVPEIEYKSSIGAFGVDLRNITLSVDKRDEEILKEAGETVNKFGRINVVDDINEYMNIDVTKEQENVQAM